MSRSAFGASGRLCAIVVFSCAVVSSEHRGAPILRENGDGMRQRSAWRTRRERWIGDPWQHLGRCGRPSNHCLYSKCCWRHSPRVCKTAMYRSWGALSMLSSARRLSAGCAVVFARRCRGSVKRAQRCAGQPLVVWGRLANALLLLARQRLCAGVRCMSVCVCV